MAAAIKKRWWQILTVEPAIFIVITSSVLTHVVEQAYFVHKACTVDVGYPLELCQNLTANITAKAEVQKTVSTFSMFNEVAYQVVPVSLSLFMGAWSDRRGRKILLLMGLLGKLWYAGAMAVGTTQETWSIYMVLFTCTLPASFTGFELAMHTSAFGYLSDVSSEEDRTFRITLMEVITLTAVPIGIYLGTVLFDALDHSFTPLYVIYTCGIVVSILYTFFRLKWATTPEQKPLDICCMKTGGSSLRRDQQPNCCLDFFSFSQFLESAKVIFKERPNKGRAKLYLLAIGMLLNGFQREEFIVGFLYTQLAFSWDVNEFSHFRMYNSIIYIFGTLVSLPLMNTYLKLSDTTILMVCAVFSGVARIVYALGRVPWLLYVGATLSCLGPVSSAALKSMASKLIPPNERGKVFVLLALADNTNILVCAVVFSRVYNATILTAPYAFFWVTVITQVVVFAIALLVKWTTSRTTEDDGEIEEGDKEEGEEVDDTNENVVYSGESKRRFVASVKN